MLSSGSLYLSDPPKALFLGYESNVVRPPKALDASHLPIDQLSRGRV